MFCASSSSSSICLRFSWHELHNDLKMKTPTLVASVSRYVHATRYVELLHVHHFHAMAISHSSQNDHEFRIKCQHSSVNVSQERQQEELPVYWQLVGLALELNALCLRQEKLRANDVSKNQSWSNAGSAAWASRTPLSIYFHETSNVNG